MLVFTLQVYRMGGLGEYRGWSKGVVFNETKSFYSH
jgi:hypothetical protein